MDLDSKYIYKNKIVDAASRIFLYKKNDVIFTSFNLDSEDGSSSVINLYYSEDDGETWVQDTLPSYSYSLYDSKLIIIDGIYYLFAYGNNSSGVYTIKYCKKIKDAWDSNWTELLDSTTQCKVTDICVDSTESFIHIAYEKLNSNNKYCVNYAALSTVNYSIVYDSILHNVPSKHQYNLKVEPINDSVLAFSWSQENDNNVNQIFYCQYDYIGKEWSDILCLSSKSNYNNYHQTMAVDNYETVHITWLCTSDEYSTDTIQYTKIVNFSPYEEETISVNAANNKYPFVICDSNDNLFILFNLSTDSVQYLTLKHDSEKWVSVTNISSNKWILLYGYCVDNNIYTIVEEDSGVNFVRIDVDLAETFAPINDFHLTSVDNSKISFEWTKARNAEKIILEQISQDTWNDATLIKQISVNDTSATVISLEPGKYKFRLICTLQDNSESIVYINGINVITEKQNLDVNWELLNSVISLKLQYSKETWESCVEIVPTYSSYTLSFSGIITKFRLNVIGGVCEGYSNEIKPLSINLTDDNDINLTWNKIENILDLKVQQTIDGEYWYDINTNEITISSEECIIKKLENVVYRFRLKYINSSNSTVYSNTVSIMNCLKCYSFSYNSVTLNWIDITANEYKKVQYSENDGVSWINSVNVINENITTITKLNYNKKYLFRIYMPSRYSGVYSNVIEITTKPKPIDDLKLIDVNTISANFNFTLDAIYNNVIVYITNTVTNEVKQYNFNNVKQSVNNNVFDFILNNLDLGAYYNIYVNVDSGDRAGSSNIVSFNTIGNGPKNVKCSQSPDSMHSIIISSDSLSKIDINNVNKFVSIKYTFDDINFNVIQATTINDIKIDNLMQNTTYKIQLIVKYGDNYGNSDIISFATGKTNFNPVYGERLPNERSMCNILNEFYIFDRGILYQLNNTDSTQNVVCDYEIDSINCYSDITIDNSNMINLIFSYGKNIFYCFNSSSSYNVSNKILLSENGLINSYLNVKVKVNSDNSVIMIWEEDYGNYSNICLAKFKNGVKIDENRTILSDKKRNHAPKLVLKKSGGFYVVCIDEDNTLKIINSTINNDYTSSDYLLETITTTSVSLTDCYSDWFNNFNICVDNLDNLRIFYDSGSDSNKTSTYITYINDVIKKEFSFNNMYDMHIISINELFIIGRNNSDVYTSKYSVDMSTFTDTLLMDNIAVDNSPLTFCYDDKNIYILSFHNGEFLVYNKTKNDLISKNNYINSTWIDNKFGLTTNDAELEIWTNGDVSNYPTLYLKCNNIVTDISQRNSDGSLSNKTISIISLENIDLTNIEANDNQHVNASSKETIKITYNVNSTLYIDLTDLLYYTWDLKTIVNIATK